MPRHEKPDMGGYLPEWVKKETDPCLVSTAEEAYTARFLAEQYRATDYSACDELLRAAAKSLKTLENASTGRKARCEAGDRATRKFWEAKSCARRLGGGA